MENEIRTFHGGIAPDDRGNVRFVNDFNFDGVKRFYQVENYDKGFVRAWHGHFQEGKYVYVAAGSALVGVVKLNAPKSQSVLRLPDIGPVHSPGELVHKCVLSAVSPKVLWIPPGHANGFKTLEDNTKILFFSTSTLEESKGDDYRFPYDQWNIWEPDYR
jgi:dTDP-4-dehydrorhamnose 3,5-epimerase-like enzyme